MAEQGLVLLTGASGFLGFTVLLQALQAGYHVRAAVRSEAKADIVRTKAAAREDQLSFTIVPDFLADNAFDEAVKGAKHIIHVASPLVGSAEGDPEDVYIRPAVQGTLGLLESVKRQGQGVQRVVVTSSLVANIKFEELMVKSSGRIVTAGDRQAVQPAPYPHPFMAYVASKTAALNKAEEWVKSQPNLTFDVIHIHPSFIFGRDSLALDAAGLASSTNGLLLRLALGGWDDNFTAASFAFCNVADVARVHLGALASSVPGNQSFIVSNDGRDGGGWEDIRSIIAKHYPEEVKRGLFKSEGKTYASILTKVDKAKTEKTFGFKLADFETTVRHVLDQYLELEKK